eukprot:gene956-4201_t
MDSYYSPSNQADSTENHDNRIPQLIRISHQDQSPSHSFYLQDKKFESHHSGGQYAILECKEHSSEFRSSTTHSVLSSTHSSSETPSISLSPSLVNQIPVSFSTAPTQEQRTIKPIATSPVTSPVHRKSVATVRDDDGTPPYKRSLHEKDHLPSTQCHRSQECSIEPNFTKADTWSNNILSGIDFQEDNMSWKNQYYTSQGQSFDLQEPYTRKEIVPICCVSSQSVSRRSHETKHSDSIKATTKPPLREPTLHYQYREQLNESQSHDDLKRACPTTANQHDNAFYRLEEPLNHEDFETQEPITTSIKISTAIPPDILFSGESRAGSSTNKHLSNQESSNPNCSSFKYKFEQNLFEGQESPNVLHKCLTLCQGESGGPDYLGLKRCNQLPTLKFYPSNTHNDNSIAPEAKSALQLIGDAAVDVNREMLSRHIQHDGSIDSISTNLSFTKPGLNRVLVNNPASPKTDVRKGLKFKCTDQCVMQPISIVPSTAGGSMFCENNPSDMILQPCEKPQNHSGNLDQYVSNLSNVGLLQMEVESPVDQQGVDKGQLNKNQFNCSEHHESHSRLRPSSQFDPHAYYSARRILSTQHSTEQSLTSEASINHLSSSDLDQKRSSHSNFLNDVNVSFRQTSNVKFCRSRSSSSLQSNYQTWSNDGRHVHNFETENGLPEESTQGKNSNSSSNMPFYPPPPLPPVTHTDVDSTRIDIPPVITLNDLSCANTQNFLVSSQRTEKQDLHSGYSKLSSVNECQAVEKPPVSCKESITEFSPPNTPKKSIIKTPNKSSKSRRKTQTRTSRSVQKLFHATNGLQTVRRCLVSEDNDSNCSEDRKLSSRPVFPEVSPKVPATPKRTATTSQRVCTGKPVSRTSLSTTAATRDTSNSQSSSASLTPTTNSVRSSVSSSKANPSTRTLVDLSNQFYLYFQERKGETVDINQAAAFLGVTKRRIYDITNVMEGIKLIRKVQKNKFVWVGPSQSVSNEYIQSLEAEVSQLVKVEEQLHKKVNYMRELLREQRDCDKAKQFAYISSWDLIHPSAGLLSHYNAIVQGPKDTTIEAQYPNADTSDSFQIRLTHKTTPLNVCQFQCNEPVEYTASSSNSFLSAAPAGVDLELDPENLPSLRYGHPASLDLYPHPHYMGQSQSHVFDSNGFANEADDISSNLLTMAHDRTLTETDFSLGGLSPCYIASFLSSSMHGVTPFETDLCPILPLLPHRNDIAYTTIYDHDKTDQSRYLLTMD